MHANSSFTIHPQNPQFTTLRDEPVKKISLHLSPVNFTNMKIC